MMCRRSLPGHLGQRGRRKEYGRSESFSLEEIGTSLLLTTYMRGLLHRCEALLRRRTRRESEVKSHQGGLFDSGSDTGLL